jgi:hypothetical protein
MATITSAASGNFSDTATWVGGVVPTVGDIAVAATGHVIAIDVDTTVDKVTQAGTGKFTLGNGITLTAEVEANAGTFTSGGTVEVTATSGNTAYIIGNVTGVSTTTANVAAVVVTGAGVLDLTGNVESSVGVATSEANANAGVYSNATNEIIITGNVTGGSSAGPGARKVGVRLGSLSATQLTIIGNVSATQALASVAHGVFVESSTSTIDITGNVLGGNGATSYGIQSTGSATIIVTGNVQGGIVTGASTFGINSATNVDIIVIGDVLGGNTPSAHGISLTGSSASATITGSVLGGPGSGAYGISTTGASSFVDVVGIIEAQNGNHALVSTATSIGVRLAGDLIDLQEGIVACWTRVFRLASTAPSGVTQYANDASFPTGGLVSRVSPDNVTGMPAQADVRDGLTFGYNSELEGTLAVPPAASVAAGVPVDATVGTAAVRLQDIADVTGAQIAAAITS